MHKTASSLRSSGMAAAPPRGTNAPAGAASTSKPSPHHASQSTAEGDATVGTSSAAKHLIPPLELTTELNPRNFALILLQRLGNYGVSNLESAVRGCGVRGISGDEFVDACLRCLAHSILLPDACSYPWQRRCVVAGSGPSQERSYESDALVAAMGFLPPSITTHAGMNFVDPGDRYPFFSEGGAHIERRSKFVARTVQRHKDMHAPLQSSIECFDQGESLTYALTLLYHTMDVHNADALSWEELATFFSDVTTRGAARLGSTEIQRYVTFVSREIQFPRSLRIMTATSTGGGGGSGSSSATDAPSISESIPPTINCAAYNAANHRFAVATSGGAVALLDGSSFTLRDTILDNAGGRGYGVATCMDYFHRVQRHSNAAGGGGKHSLLDDGGGHGVVAVASSDCCLRLYDDTTHETLCVKPYGSAQTAMKYMPSLRSIVTGARSGLLSLLVSRNHRRWQPQMFSSALQHPINAFTYQQRTANILVATAGGHIASFDADNGRMVANFQTPVPCDIPSIDYSPHFDVVAYAGVGNSPCLLVPGSGFTPITIQESDSAHMYPLRRVQFVASTPQLLSFDASGLVKVWDLRNRQCVQTMQTCRRVPQKMYAFPADDVAHRSKALRGLMTAHETSTEFRSPCHTLVYASNVGERIAVIDGAGVQVLQPTVSLHGGRQTGMELEEGAEEDDTLQTIDAPKEDEALKPPATIAELLEATSEAAIEAKARAPKKQRIEKECMRQLDTVELPGWFAYPVVPPPQTASPSDPLRSAAGSPVPAGKQRIHQLRREAEAHQRQEAQHKALQDLCRGPEAVIVGHSDTAIYLWRVSTGEALLKVPLRVAYEQWRDANEATMHVAREQKRRERELEAMRFSPSFHRSGGGGGAAASSSATDGDNNAGGEGQTTSPTESQPQQSSEPHAADERVHAHGTMSVMTQHVMKTVTDRAARAAAHPRYFALQQPLTIRSVLLCFDASAPSCDEPPPQDVAYVHALTAGFDIGLDDGTTIHLPIQLQLWPPHLRARAAPPTAPVMDALGCLPRIPLMTASFDFDTQPPFALFRPTHFLTLSMVEDMRAGAEPPVPAVTCIRSLKIVDAPVQPYWYRRGATALDDLAAAGLARAAPVAAQEAPLAAECWASAEHRQGLGGGPWLLEGAVRKERCSVRVATGATAIVYLGRYVYPTESAVGLPDQPRGVTHSLQLTGAEPGRPYATALWCSALPTVPEPAPDRSSLSTFGGDDANSCTQSALQKGDDVVVYVGMSNNVNLFYTVRLVGQKRQHTATATCNGSDPAAASVGSAGSGEDRTDDGATPTAALGAPSVSPQRLVSPSASEGMELVVQRVVRLRTMPDNAILHRCFPITSTSLVVAADSVGGVQLLFAPLMSAHHPTCLSRFTAFQPADEAYTPLVVAAVCTDHGLLCLAAGAHVSIFSVHQCWKSCFPEDWAQRWRAPQDLAVEANASPAIVGGAADASEAERLTSELKEQIAQQPPTPSVVRYFDVKDVCKAITAMVYLPAKQCLLIGGDDGRLHVFTLWGVQVSVNAVPRRTPSLPPSRVADGDGGCGAPPPQQQQQPTNDAPRQGRHLSALVAQNRFGTSVVFHADGAVLGEMQALEDDVPYPWGQGKPLAIYRHANKQDDDDAPQQHLAIPRGRGAKGMHSGSSASFARQSFAGMATAQHSFVRGASRAGGAASGSGAVAGDATPLGMTFAMELEGVSSSSASEEDPDDDGDSLVIGGEASSRVDVRHASVSDAGSEFGGRINGGAAALRGPLAVVHRVHPAGAIARHEDGVLQDTSASLVQPSAAQRLHLAANKHGAVTGEEVGRTVDALQNQDVFERFSGLEGEEKVSHIMMELLQRAKDQAQAKVEIVERRRQRSCVHQTMIQDLRDACRQALEEMELDAAGLSEDDPSLRQFVNLNSNETERAFNANGVESKTPSAASSTRRRRSMASLVPSAHGSITSLPSNRGGFSRSPPPKANKEKELLSFASAAGSLLKRFRNSRSKSLHAALSRLVGSEREMAGDLSVDADQDERVERDARHDEQRVAAAKEARRRASSHLFESHASYEAAESVEVMEASLDAVPRHGGGGDGSAPHHVQHLRTFRFGSIGDDNHDDGGSAEASFGFGRQRHESAVEEGGVQDREEIEEDTFEVQAVTNRRGSTGPGGGSRCGSLTHRDSVASSTASCVASPRQRFGSTSGGVGAGGMPMSSPSPRQSFLISKSDALSTRRKSVSLLSAVDDGSAAAPGNERSDAEASLGAKLRWSHLVADRRGMRQRSRTSVVQLSHVEGGGDEEEHCGTPERSSKRAQRVTLLPEDDASPTDAAAVPSVAMVDDPPSVSVAGAALSAAAPFQRTLIGTQGASPLHTSLGYLSASGGASVAESPLPFLEGGGAAEGLRAQLHRPVVTASLLDIRALEGVVDAANTTRHVVPLLSRRLFHRCKASPPMMAACGETGGEPNGKRQPWVDPDAEARDAAMQLSQLSADASRRLYGPPRPMSAMSGGSNATAAMRSRPVSAASGASHARAPAPNAVVVGAKPSGGASSTASFSNNVVFKLSSVQDRINKRNHASTSKRGAR